MRYSRSVKWGLLVVFLGFVAIGAKMILDRGEQHSERAIREGRDGGARDHAEASCVFACIGCDLRCRNGKQTDASAQEACSADCYATSAKCCEEASPDLIANANGCGCTRSEKER